MSWSGTWLQMMSDDALDAACRDSYGPLNRLCLTRGRVLTAVETSGRFDEQDRRWLLEGLGAVEARLHRVREALIAERAKRRDAERRRVEIAERRREAAAVVREIARRRGALL